MSDAPEYTPLAVIELSDTLRFRSDLSASEKLFLAEIQAMTKNGNTPAFTSRYFGDLFKVSHQTIINWIKKLCKMGLIEVQFNFSDDQKKLEIKSK